MQKIIVFTIGTIVGSFLALVAERVPENRSIIFPASYCTSCKTKLHPIDLIPVWSQLFQRSKCRYCGKHFSYTMIFTELICGFTFCLYFPFYLEPQVTINFILTLTAITLSLTDYYYYLVEPRILYASGLLMITLTLIFRTIHYPYFLTAIVMWAALRFLDHLLPNSLGLGDRKLLIIWSCFLSFYQILWIVFIGSIAGTFFFILQHRFSSANTKDLLPFVPFLSIGLFITLWFPLYF